VKFARQNRILLATSTAFIVLLIQGTTISVTRWVRNELAKETVQAQTAENAAKTSEMKALHERDCASFNKYLASITGAQSLLETTRPPSDEAKDFRGVEWAWSRDSKFIASRSGDHVQIWDVLTSDAKLKKSFLTRHGNRHFMSRRIKMLPDRDILLYEMAPEDDESDSQVVLYDYINDMEVDTLLNAGGINLLSSDGNF
jgi:hypothetical protein